MRPIALDSVGDEVLDIQRRLTSLGFPSVGDEPGVFGPATLRAVRSFQQQRHLTADGIVGDDTWRSLVEAGYRLGDRLLYPTRPMLRGDDVRDLQGRLNRLGFDAGHEDAVLGPQTAAAIREFQLNAGLTVDGIAGRETVEVLRRLHRTHQSAPAATVRERELLHRRARPSLVGAVLLIDPAHGPDDPGIVANGAEEHRLTWTLASRLAGRLSALGARPVLSRGPETTPPPTARARLANRRDVDAIISIHLNHLAARDARGAAAYYFGTDGYVSERGRVLADLCVDHVVRRTGTAHCRSHPVSSILVQRTRAPAVIVEPGFLTHDEEGRLLQERAYQHHIVEALVTATAEFLTGDPSLDPVTGRPRSLVAG